MVGQPREIMHENLNEYKNAGGVKAALSGRGARLGQTSQKDYTKVVHTGRA